MNNSLAALAEIDQVNQSYLRNGDITVVSSHFDDEVVPLVYQFNMSELFELLVSHACTTIAFNRMVTILDKTPQQRLNAQNLVLSQRIWMSFDNRKRQLPLGGLIVSLGLNLTINYAHLEMQTWIVSGMNELQVLAESPRLTTGPLIFMSDLWCVLL